MAYSHAECSVMVLAAVAAWIVRLRAEFETLFPKKVLEETGKTV